MPKVSKIPSPKLHRFIAQPGDGFRNQTKLQNSQIDAFRSLPNLAFLLELFPRGAIVKNPVEKPPQNFDNLLHSLGMGLRTKPSCGMVG
jgi:hypothetical protein